MAASEGDGNGWVVSAAGDRRWGRFGAAGLLLRAADPTDPETPLVLLQHRAVWTASGDTWALPGGARDSYEDAPEAALRETQEEAEIRPADVIVRAVRVTARMSGTLWHRPGLDMRHVAEMMRRLRPDQHHSDDPDARGRTIPPLVQESADAVEWTYTTVVADAPRALETVPNNESLELRWVPEPLVAELPLMPAFAQAWADGLRTEPVELVVDVANVLGSRPDGWWKDRAGATTRLLDELGAALPRTVELPGGFGWVAGAHAVIEGAARAAEHSGPLVVHRAPGSGDDAIADLAAELAGPARPGPARPGPVRPGPVRPGPARPAAAEGSTQPASGGSRRVVVVTADRGLRARLPETVLVVGPRALLG